jgi:hypothetical protein
MLSFKATLAVEALSLKVFQSVDVRNPLVLVVAWLIVILGVVPPLDDKGADAVTEVTVPPLEGEVFVTVKLG